MGYTSVLRYWNNNVKKPIGSPIQKDVESIMINRPFKTKCHQQCNVKDDDRINLRRWWINLFNHFCDESIRLNDTTDVHSFFDPIHIISLH